MEIVDSPPANPKSSPVIAPLKTFLFGSCGCGPQLNRPLQETVPENPPVPMKTSFMVKVPVVIGSPTTSTETLSKCRPVKPAGTLAIVLVIEGVNQVKLPISRITP